MSHRRKEGSGPASPRVDWAALTRALPMGRDDASTARREALWREWDMNGNGALSFTEVNTGLRKLMSGAMASLLPSAGATYWGSVFKPVLMRAFCFTKDHNRRSKKKAQRRDDFVEHDEFRMLLLCIRQYFEMFIAFRRLDTSGDRKLDFDEFVAALPLLERWGVQLSAEAAEADFRAIDTNSSGVITFDEFLTFGMARRLDLDDDDDFEDFGLEDGEAMY